MNEKDIKEKLKGSKFDVKSVVYLKGPGDTLDRVVEVMGIGQLSDGRFVYEVRAWFHDQPSYLVFESEIVDHYLGAL